MAVENIRQAYFFKDPTTTETMLMREIQAVSHPLLALSLQHFSFCSLCR